MIFQVCGKESELGESTTQKGACAGWPEVIPPSAPGGVG